MRDGCSYIYVVLGMGSQNLCSYGGPRVPKIRSFHIHMIPIKHVKGKITDVQRKNFLRDSSKKDDSVILTKHHPSERKSQ